MNFPNEIWRQIKNYMLGKEYWKRKLKICLISSHPIKCEHGIVYSYYTTRAISHYRPFMYCHRAERYHFNLVTEYWKGISYSGGDVFRIEPVTHWVDFH